MRSSIHSMWPAFLFAALLSSAMRAHSQVAEDPLAQLSLEQLTQVQVVSASGYLQAPEEAPASVSIVTEDDIRNFGFRTLADILNSVRSLFITSDRDYTSLGVRGISRPGDFNTRVLLLIDGHRMNDDVYDQAMIGTEFPLDVDLIERVEVIRGPVSSLYGSNALLGVINVITRSGRDLKGGEVAGTVASFDTGQLRLSYGAHHGGLDIVASTTLFRSRGHRSLYYPEYDTPATNDGLAQNADHSRVQSAFLSVAYNELTLHALFGTRMKQIPTAPYQATFDDPGTHTIDTHTFFDLQEEHSFSKTWSLLARAYFDNYHYAGTYEYAADADAAQRSPEIDSGYGQWAGAEARITAVLPKGTGVGGLEVRDHLRQNQTTYDLNPFVLDLQDQRASYVLAPYAQYEGALTHKLKINAGLRYDYYSDTAGSLDPRIALIYEPLAKTVLRASYGASFRAPNVYERFYAVAPNAANPGLSPEKVRTFELMWDQKLPARFTLATSAFKTGVHGLIDQVGDDQTSALTFQNAQSVSTTGVETELSLRQPKGSLLDVSYTFQQTHDQATGDLLSNSPKSLVKLNAAAVIPHLGWTASADAQYVARMISVHETPVSPYTIVNATALSSTLWRHLTFSASAYNLLNKQYSDPAPGFYTQSTIPQDGRSLRFKAVWELGRRL